MHNGTNKNKVTTLPADSRPTSAPTPAPAPAPYRRQHRFKHRLRQETIEDCLHEVPTERPTTALTALRRPAADDRPTAPSSNPTPAPTQAPTSTPTSPTMSLRLQRWYGGLLACSLVCPRPLPWSGMASASMVFLLMFHFIAATDTYSFGLVAYFDLTSRPYRHPTTLTVHLEWPASSISFVCQEADDDCPREVPTERPMMAATITYFLIWIRRLFRSDLDALTASNNPHRAPGVARKQHYTRVPGNRRRLPP